jgi:hypothetical protein
MNGYNNFNGNVGTRAGAGTWTGMPHHMFAPVQQLQNLGTGYEMACRDMDIDDCKVMWRGLNLQNLDQPAQPTG